MNKNPKNIMKFCDNEELKFIHPKNILSNRVQMAKLKSDLDTYNDPMMFHAFEELWFNRNISLRWLNPDYFDLQLASPLAWFISSHYNYRDFCQK